MIVYMSGPITGVENYAQPFDLAEGLLPIWDVDGKWL